MKRQTSEIIYDRNSPRPDHAAIQDLRCWMLLNHILGRKIAIKAPAAIATRRKRKRAA